MSPRMALPCLIGLHISILILLHLALLALSLSFNYTSMGNGTAQYLAEIGNVSFAPDYVELTWFAGSPALSAGRVYNQDELLLWDSASNQAASFNCSFEFAIVVVGNTSADGLAFFLLDPSLSQIPSNGKGGWLGLLNATTNATTSASVVAVEFDTFQDSYDPNDNHVGIDVNTIVSVKYSNLTFPLSASSTVFAWIDYSSSQYLLDVYATNVSSVKPSHPLISQTLNLTNILPEKVLIGFSAATGTHSEFHRILSWSFNSTSIASSKSKKNILKTIIFSNNFTMVLKILGVLLVLVLLVLCKLQRQKKLRRRRLQKLSGIDISSSADIAYGPFNFSYKELKEATNNFDKESMLGKGGSGSVYIGVSPIDQSTIAVKQILQKSTEGEREFFAEVSIITRIRHKNLVQLKGWCKDQSNLLLVYEYLPNGSLDRHLFSKDSSLFLNWSQRYNIMCGLGSALEYLHQGCEKVIVHRDIKASNVLLDASYNAKLGDFGLARQFGGGTDGHTTIVAGTIGYMAPETFGTGRATTETDVYSYGIVLLEVACGRRPVGKYVDDDEDGERHLLEWVWGLHGEGRLREAADSRLEGDCDDDELVRTLKVGLACAHPDPKQRPSIHLALEALQGRLPVPAVPAFKPVAYYGPPPSMDFFSTSAIPISADRLPAYSSFCAPDSERADKALLR